MNEETVNSEAKAQTKLTVLNRRGQNEFKGLFENKSAPTGDMQYIQFILYIHKGICPCKTLLLCSIGTQYPVGQLIRKAP